MKVFDLKFTDGRTCRAIALETEPTDQADIDSLIRKFGADRVTSVERVFPTPPARLPWERQSNSVWTLGLFVLTRVEAGVMSLTWPDGELVGDKEEISAVVRMNWHHAC